MPWGPTGCNMRHTYYKKSEMLSQSLSLMCHYIYNIKYVQWPHKQEKVIVKCL